MRKFARVDKAQKEVVEALRMAGASVVSLAPIGRGCPDLLVGYMGRNLLLEVKSGEAKRNALTPDQRRFVEEWRGQWRVVVDADDALLAIRSENARSC